MIIESLRESHQAKNMLVYLRAYMDLKQVITYLLVLIFFTEIENQKFTMLFLKRLFLASKDRKNAGKYH